MKDNDMKRLMKVNVTTRKKGIFGIREVVENKTIMLPGKACFRMKQEKWNKPFCGCSLCSGKLREKRVGRTLYKFFM